MDPDRREAPEEAPSATPLEGDAAAMALVGPAVLLGALAPDTVELRRRLEAGLVLPNHEECPAGTPPTEAVSGRRGG